MLERSDKVVIMARGRSERMGQPKGALICPGTQGDSFLTAIVQLYASVGLSGVVITTKDLVALYEPLIPPLAEFQVLAFAGGGDTGRTLIHGLSVFQKSATHLWAHPVDLPLVETETIAKVRGVSLERPQSCVRPIYLQEVGHPVVIPAAMLTSALGEDEWQMAPVREIFASRVKNGEIEEAQLVAVNDSGVVTDFDRPNDFLPMLES